MRRNLLTIIFCVVALVSVVSLAAFTFANPDTNISGVKLNEASSSDVSEQMNESVETVEEPKTEEKPSTEVSSTPQQAVQSEEVEETELSFDKVKTLTVQGKKITANFVERQEMENPNYHAKNVYKTNDGVTLKYDSVTGELVRMMSDINEVKGNDKIITEKDAVLIAEEFIKTNAAYLDLEKYQFIGCKYYENFKSYDVDYSWLYNGYNTKDSIKVTVEENGQISFFYANPYIFDNVERKLINEQALLKQLDTLVHKHKKDIVSYEVTNRIIGVDNDNDMIMLYDVVIEFEVPRENKEISINEKGEIKVFESEKKTNVFTQGVVFEIKI